MKFVQEAELIVNELVATKETISYLRDLLEDETPVFEEMCNNTITRLEKLEERFNQMVNAE